MSHLKVHDHYRTMTRAEVAAELHRLATQLESAGGILYATGAIAAPARVEREFKIDESSSGAAFRFQYRPKWPVRDD
jgi:hypothetical protein